LYRSLVYHIHFQNHYNTQDKVQIGGIGVAPQQRPGSI